MVLDTTLLNTQHYKVRFKGKVGAIPGEWSSAPSPYTLGVVAIEKGSLRGPPSTMGPLTLLFYLYMVYIYKYILSFYMIYIYI